MNLLTLTLLIGAIMQAAPKGVDAPAGALPINPRIGVVSVMAEETITQKTCIKCGETKPVIAFHKNAKSPGGVLGRCRECRKTTRAAERAKKARLSELKLAGLATCKKCGEVKPVTAFYRVGAPRVRGYRPRCIACMTTGGKRGRACPERHKDGLVHCRKCDEWKTASAFHKDKRRTAGLSFYCRECVKAYQQNNKERMSANALRWQQANAERYCELRREWMRAHPEKRLEHQRTRRARVAGCEGRFTTQEWQTLKEFHGFACLKCGRAEPEIKLAADHVVPVSSGGLNTIENIQPLCKSCNSSKATKTIDYRPAYKEGQNRMVKVSV
jgi:5-methylcytosine-specific restriction endonuclease McrA